MKSFNLSEWAIKHRSFVWFFMLLFVVAGVLSYAELGREEDPSFSIKTMIVQTYWPGATIDDTMLQITDRIEKKLQETPSLYYLKSETKPGISTVYVNVLDSTPKNAIPDIWYQVRKKVADIKGTLPQGVLGPYFNDEFGDVFGIIYAFTANDFSQRELRDYVEKIRTQMLAIKNAAKAQLIGAQDQKFYLEFDTRQLAGLGVSRDQVISSLQEQNAVTPSGVVQTGLQKFSIRVSGAFSSVDDLKHVNFFANGKFFRLADVATIRKGYADPPQPMFRFNGEPAIGLAISMAQGGNNLVFGEAVAHKMAEITSKLPVGIEPHLVADQSVVVEEAVGGFTKALWEAIAIVLGVSFLSLGLRAGVVVACSIPLVLGMVFVYMEYSGISLQRISLGALIISLGLLVDDAMITIEMMVSQLELGVDREHSATHAWTTTAFPMLTGTLVTVAGFVPIGFAKSGAGEYCYSLFAVIAVALLASWIVAVLFAPVIGVTILPRTMKRHGDGHAAPGRFMRLFRAALIFCMRARWLVIAVTVGLFAASLYGYGFIQQQFFPASDRPELIVDLNLPQDASIYATEHEVERFERLLKGDPNIDHYSFYVGQGAVRFYLPLNVQLANDYFAEAVIVTKGIKEREVVRARLQKALDSQFANLNSRISALELGPPVGWPLQYRVSGATPQGVRDAAFLVAQTIGQNPNTRLINFDWNEPMKSLRTPGRSGPGPSARGQFQIACRSLECRYQRHGRHRGPQLDLSDRSYGSGDRGATRLATDLEKSASRAGQRQDHPAEPGRHHSIRVGTAGDLAPQSAADHHGSGQRRAGHTSKNGKQSVGAGDRRCGTETAGGLHDRSRWHDRGKRQRAQLDRRCVSADDRVDADHSDGPAAKLSEDVSGDQRRTAGSDRRRRGSVADRHTDGVRRNPRNYRVERDDHPQFCDPGRSDRHGQGQGTAPLGCGDRRDDKPLPADRIDRSRSLARHDPDRVRGVLGTDGLRHYRGTHCRDAADPAIPARSLRRLVSDQRASKGAVGECHRAGAGSRPYWIFAIGGFVGSGGHIRKQAPMIHSFDKFPNGRGLQLFRP